jgi:hypothetical protein
MPIENFRDTLDFWINELDKYDFISLCAKPSQDNWSIGQVYMHLIKNTEWFLEQVTICATTNDHDKEKASTAAKEMFHYNSFPDAVLEGPPENANTSQPLSKEQLLNDHLRLKDKIHDAETLILKTSFRGKTKHPGLRYFSAGEWFHFAEMHFRHHLKQKKKLDDFLKINNYL